MMLEKILANTRAEVAERKRLLPFNDCRAWAEAERSRPSFRAALDQPGVNIIAEIKKASPSRGIICADFDPATIARDYQAGGAAAISVLTDRRFFQGELRYLDDIAAQVNLPLLRKDFIIDAYQIYEAKIHRASAVLLLANSLEVSQLNEYLDLCASLALDALVEVHDARELDAVLRTPAPIIGVNNRDLRTFVVDLQTGLTLAPLIPKNRLKVSESGIFSRQHVALLQNVGYHAFLVGESLMRSENRSTALRALRGQDVH